MNFNENAFDTACRYLSARMRSSGEVKKHLKEKGDTDTEIKEAVTELCERRYLDDVQYAVNYIEYSFAKGRGKLRMIEELRQKSVSREDIEAAFCEYGQEHGDAVFDEKQRAYEQAVACIGRAEITDKTLAKAGRKLVSLGYGSDAVYHALGRLMRKNN